VSGARPVDDSLRPTGVLVKAPEGALTADSIVLLNQIRSVDKRRLVKRLGAVRAATMTHVNQAMMISLALIELGVILCTAPRHRGGSSICRAVLERLAHMLRHVSLCVGVPVDERRTNPVAPGSLESRVRRVEGCSRPGAGVRRRLHLQGRRTWAGLSGDHLQLRGVDHHLAA
jgi:mRNA interferase MazF